MSLSTGASPSPVSHLRCRGVGSRLLFRHTVPFECLLTPKLFCLHSWSLVPCMSIPSDALRRHARRGNEPTSRRLYDLFSSRIHQQRPSSLSHYWNPTSDNFSDTLTNPPQYEASSLVFLNATRPTSVCRPIQSSDSTTAAGEASISPTPQLLSTWSSVAAALGWDWDLQPLLPLVATLAIPRLRRSYREKRKGEQIFQMFAERPYRLDLDLTSVSYSFFFLLLSVTTPIDEIAFSRGLSFTNPLICSAW